MISELNIKAYRGIHNLNLNNLGRVNIIAGSNNTGKTSILEVIESLAAPNNIRNWRLIGRREGSSQRMVTTTYDTMKSLFPMELSDKEMIISYDGVANDESFKIEIKAEEHDTIVSETQMDKLIGFSRIRDDDENSDKEYETKLMNIGYSINGNKCGNDIILGIQRGIPFQREEQYIPVVDNIQYIPPFQHTQNILFLNSLMTNPDLYEQFVEIMREFDPNFISINAVEDERISGRKYVVLSKNHKEGLLLNAYGDGMKKAMLLLSSVIKAKNGVLLLDEFETGIHISAMEKVFRLMLDVAVKLNVQIFMTSHSLEAIETVLKCNPVTQEDIRMITLVKVDDKIKMRNVNAAKAIQLLDEYGMELR